LQMLKLVNNLSVGGTGSTVPFREELGEVIKFVKLSIPPT